MRSFLFLALLAPAIAHAVPSTFTHQGALADASGAALDGSYNLTFKLYTAASGGSAVWEETVAANIVGGTYSVTLGATTPFGSALDSSELYLGISIDSGPELSPRQMVNSVPYAARASVAESISGGLSWDAIDGVPASLTDGDSDTLASLGCSSGEVAVFDGSSWGCGSAGASSFDASAITSGTVSVDRLPVGNSNGQVAAGDHTHGFSTITGQAAISQLPVGTTANDVAAGNHTHTAAEVGALPASGGTLTGSLQVGTTSATCNTAAAGTIRWNSKLEVCDGTAWRPLEVVGNDDGETRLRAGKSCKSILTKYPASSSKLYWLDPDGDNNTANAFQTYCDMTRNGGGWTLVMQNVGAVAFNGNRPSFASTVSDVLVRGGSLSDDLASFDILVGLGYWANIGQEARYETGATVGVPQRQATFTSLQLTGSTYTLTLSTPNVTIGSGAPGLHSYHNGRAWTTVDRDNDAYSANCEASYYHPFWYGSCWSGSIWGSNAGNYTVNAYWDGSGSEYYNWGALWLR